MEPLNDNFSTPGEGLLGNEATEETGAERSRDIFLMDLFGQLDAAMPEAITILRRFTKANTFSVSFFFPLRVV